MAAPTAPVTWACGATITGTPIASPKADAMPSTSATPPVRTTGPSDGRPNIAATRLAIAFLIPAMMLAGGAPEASSPTISVSAKTAQVLLIGAGSTATPPSSPRPPSGI